jgi:hypothetical protein
MNFFEQKKKQTNKRGVSCVAAFADWEFDAFFFTKIECVG